MQSTGVQLIDVKAESGTNSIFDENLGSPLCTKLHWIYGAKTSMFIDRPSRSLRYRLEFQFSVCSPTLFSKRQHRAPDAKHQNELILN